MSSPSDKDKEPGSLFENESEELSYEKVASDEYETKQGSTNKRSEKKKVRPVDFESGREHEETRSLLYHNIQNRVVDLAKKHKLHIQIVASLMLANFLYVITDEKCPSTITDICVKQFMLPRAPRWFFTGYVSSLIFTIVIIKSVRQKIPLFYLLIALTNVVYLFFFYHPILTRSEYGQLVALGVGIFLLGNLLLYTIGFWIAKGIQKNRNATIIGVSTLVLSLTLVFYFARVRNSSEHWSKGMGNEQIEDGPSIGIIQRPKTCVYEITDNWLDFSMFMSCSDNQSKKDIIDTYYPSETPFIGFARTENFTEEERGTLQESVLKNIVPLTGLDDPKAADLEMFLNKTSKDHAELIIKVKRNESLVKERSEKESKSLVNNVLVIYIDALSRVNTFRKLQKTTSWFDGFTQKKNPNTDTYQFFKYHAITPYTTNNLFSALFGSYPPNPQDSTHDEDYIEDKEIPEEDKLEPFLSSYKESGFITGHSTNFCQTYSLDVVNYKNLKEVPFDHESLSFACDPHYHIPDNPYGLGTGSHASLRRCLYGKDTFEHVLEFGNQFWTTYKDQKKILYMEFLDAHEGTNEVVKYLDDPLYNFLNNLQNKNMLNDTAVVLYSDHGLHMQGLWYLLNVEEVFIEISLPTFYFTLPRNISSQYESNIKENQQKLVSSHEVYDFFKTLAEGKDSESFNTSVFSPLPLYRTCDDIHLYEGWCVISYDTQKTEPNN